MSFDLHEPELTPAPDRTREQLIEAAAAVFARAGFRAATVREICQKAGANIAAVNYHFGDKEALYAEVLSHALQRARQKYPPELGLGPKATPEERLHAFVHSFLLRIFDDGPHAHHAKLMAREMVEPTAALDRLVREEIGPMAGTLMGIVRTLLGRGASDAQLRRCGMSVVSQVLFYHHCRPVVTRLFPDLKFKPREIEELARHITGFSLAALKGQATRKKQTKVR
jgi:AcrR family transcriptional regulator